MAPISCSERQYDERERAILLDVARRSVEHGLENGCPLAVETEPHGERLTAARACFVTLRLEGALRGCVGSLRAHRSLVSEVARSAYSAGFKDPRFPPMTRGELAGLDIHISVLSLTTPMVCDDERQLLAQLRPGIDGLIVREGRKTATFLPAVWDTLPDPVTFVAQLRLKAGLARDHWSESLEVERYTTESFGQAAAYGEPS